MVLTLTGSILEYALHDAVFLIYTTNMSPPYRHLIFRVFPPMIRTLVTIIWPSSSFLRICFPGNRCLLRPHRRTST